MSATETPDYSIANPSVVEKYKTAGNIANKAIAQVRNALKDGATVFELCEIGDKVMNDELALIYTSKKSRKISKGIAFPTCVNPNNIPAHLSPESAEDSSNLTLKDGDVVNIMLGVQVDGFPSIVAETAVVGESKESPITGAKADLLASAWNASEAAIRTLKPGNKNWDVTNVVDAVAKDFGTTAVQSMLSHNQERNVMYGPKEIILNPAKEHKSKMESYKIEELDVYGLDILISTSSDGKVKKSNYKTTLHKLTGNSYSLKLKSSHQALREFKEKVNGPFPANVKIFENPRKVRTGLIECANHEVVLPYEIMEGKKDDFIAQFFTTVAVTKNGIEKYTSPTFVPEFYQTDKKVTSEDIAELIKTPLSSKKAKKN
ncbi:Metallopeptidase M24 family protein [Clavispora lusitaniae]|nr:Curved DNA-binding protein (42 kDa protein) [Clavispora lusitaniae]KAF7582820.1 Metallopeptidase M24 family protein [Clavispora lusitaniae]